MARVTSWVHNRQTFAQEELKIEKHENKNGDTKVLISFLFFFLQLKMCNCLAYLSRAGNTNVTGNFLGTQSPNIRARSVKN